MSLRTDIAKNLARIRKQRGLTQAELATVSYVSRSYISRIECGRCDFTLDILERLAVALEVDAVALATSDPEEPSQITELYDK